MLNRKLENYFQFSLFSLPQYLNKMPWKISIMERTEPESIEELCRRENHFRRDYNGVYYCVANEKKCSCYDKDNKITIPLDNPGWMTDSKTHKAFHLCKRED